MLVVTGVVTTVEAAVDTAVVTAAVDTEEVAVDITEVEAGLLTTLTITQATVVKEIKGTRDIMATKRD
jgi:intein-encoded DNA endonuclease-like protein